MRFRTVARLLIVPALLAVSTPALAQNPWQVGALVGVNISNLNVDFDTANISGDGRTGLMAGLFVARDINSRVGVEIQALLSQRGAEFNVEDGLFDDDASFSLSYFEIPVLARINLASTADIAVRALVGPSFAFNVNESIKVAGIELDGDEVDLKAFEMGFSLGAAAEFRSKWIFGARYTWGLTDINGSDDEGEPTVNNGTFSIFGGFRFK